LRKLIPSVQFFKAKMEAFKGPEGISTEIACTWQHAQVKLRRCAPEPRAAPANRERRRVEQQQLGGRG
jgi:hypothetical protein